MDNRAVQARLLHREAQEHEDRARQSREQRDRLVRSLRSEDPQYWTYPRLAKAVECSPELIAVIVRGG